MENNNFKNLYKRYLELKPKTTVASNPVGIRKYYQSLNLNGLNELDKIKKEISKSVNEHWNELSADDWTDILGKEQFLKKSCELSSQDID